MYLVKLPSDPWRIVDLTKVSSVECLGGEYSGPLVFQTEEGASAALDVTVAVQWTVVVKIDGESIPWSTDHLSEQDALDAMNALADKISWGRATRGGVEDAR